MKCQGGRVEFVFEAIHAAVVVLSTPQKLRVLKAINLKLKEKTNEESKALIKGKKSYAVQRIEMIQV